MEDIKLDLTLPIFYSIKDDVYSNDYSVFGAGAELLELSANEYTNPDLTALRIEAHYEFLTSYASEILARSKQLESGAYQRKMSDTQKSEFTQWQDELLKFINGEHPDMPAQPNFITELL